MKRGNNSPGEWLPASKHEIDRLGWKEVDVIIFSGDAYIDHPSFGPAIIGRVIQNEGLRVAIIPQPNWKDDLRDFRKLGKPRYFFGVTAGNMDSMVNHYTAARRLRSDDAYTPCGRAGFRPDYPTIVYTAILKKLYPDTPVIIGGIEASMRRFTHYDYWQDRLRPSILFESRADLLVYGLGEQPVREIIRLLNKGVPFSSLKTIPQTAIRQGIKETLPTRKGWGTIVLSSFENCQADKKVFTDNFMIFERESNKIESSRLVEQAGEENVIVNPPFAPMNETEADTTYDLPYTYLPHPKYEKKGPVPAFEMIKFSVNIHRGCFGGCSFCAISAHQGKHIIKRSEKSIMGEINRLSAMKSFRGYLSDLGGPSANMYGMKSRDLKYCRKCSRPSCIWPRICNKLDTDHTRLLELYKQVNKRKDIKKAFIGSGLRYDLLFPESNPNAGPAESDYLRELIVHHVSGRLKVAPEHTSSHVTGLMRKVPFSLFRKLKKQFAEIISENGLEYEIIPYFISSHPGCTVKDMNDLARELKSDKLKPEQVQDFTPTPMTLSTLMYYTGKDPYTGENLYVAKTKEEKRKQKELFFWYKPFSAKTKKPGR